MGHVRNITTHQSSKQEYLRIVNDERRAQKRLMRQHNRDAQKKPVLGYVMAALVLGTFGIVGSEIIHWLFQ